MLKDRSSIPPISMKKSVSLNVNVNVNTTPQSPPQQPTPRRVNFSTLSPHASLNELLRASKSLEDGDANLTGYRTGTSMSIRSRNSITASIRDEILSRPANLGPMAKSRSTGSIRSMNTGAMSGTRMGMLTFASSDDGGGGDGDGGDMNMTGKKRVTDLSSSTARLWLRGGGSANSGNSGYGNSGSGDAGASGVNTNGGNRASTAPSSITLDSKAQSHGSSMYSSKQSGRSGGIGGSNGTRGSGGTRGFWSFAKSNSLESVISESRQTTPSTGSLFSFPDDVLADAAALTQSNRYQPVMYSSSLGDIYSNSNAMRAYKAGKLKSQLTSSDSGHNNDARLRVFFVNKTSETLVLCWVGFDNKLYHYYKLQPSSATAVTGGLGKGSVAGGSDINKNTLDIRIEGGVHSETTFLGHSFVIGTCDHGNGIDYGEEDSQEEEDDNDDDAYSDGQNGNHKNSNGPTCWTPFHKSSNGESDCIISIDDTCLDRTKINKIIAAYRPKKLIIPSDDTNDVNDDDDDDNDDDDGIDHNSSTTTGAAIHLVTITDELALMPKKDKRGVFPFQKTLTFFRPRKMYHLSATQCHLDSTPVDQSNKEYVNMVLGGWRVKCEKGLFSNSRSKATTDNKRNDNNSNVLSPWRSKIKSNSRTDNMSTNTNIERSDSQEMETVKEKLEMDLAAVSSKLPPAACRLLKKSTLIWINRSQVYGPRAAPISGKGLCYHPNRKWLLQNGMSPKKWRGVELYDAKDYLTDRELWHGVGGVMLHELSHAFHNKFLKDGYDNQEIIDCYNAAMEEGLYDHVQVHTMGCVDNGNNNGNNNNAYHKAYACTNALEYFAELSVAFLGGVGKDKDLEFNKWYPFNRSQLKQHDPRAYDLLKRLWENEENHTKNEFVPVELTKCKS